MNKRGFTLVEILAAIMIVGILLAITVPAVQGIISNTKNNLYNATIESIKNAANQYVVQYGANINGLYDSGVGYITLSDLENKGIINNPVKNPKTGDNFDNSVTIKITKLPNGKFQYVILLDGKPAPTVVWKKSYGGDGYTEEFKKVISTNDSYIAVGSSPSTDTDLTGLNKGGTDATIVKYDLDGNVVWKKNYGGTSTDTFLSIVAVTDGYVAAGSSNSTNTDLTGLNKGVTDAIIVKYDLDGNVVWKKNYGGTSVETFQSVIAVTDGYVAVGSSNSTNTDLSGLNKGGTDAIIVKYDLDGNVVWKKNYGGTGTDEFLDVAFTTNGYIVVGSSASTNIDLQNISKGGIDAIVVKYDLDGNIVWKKNFGGTSEDKFYAVTITNDNYIGIVGYSYSENQDLDGVIKQDSCEAIIVKYDSDGNVIWKRSYWGDFFYDIIATTSNFITVGSLTNKMETYFHIDAFVAQYDFNGAVTLEGIYKGGGDDYLYGISSINNGYIVVGSSDSNDRDFFGLNKDYEDSIIFKLLNP